MPILCGKTGVYELKVSLNKQMPLSISKPAKITGASCGSLAEKYKDVGHLMVDLIRLFPKIGVLPPNHPMLNRVFPYFRHPFWGTIIFGNIHKGTCLSTNANGRSRSTIRPESEV